MLAAAVKEKHAEIVFKPPVKATPASTAPTLALPHVPPPRRPFYFNRWAVAASVLLAIFSSGGVFGWTMWQKQADGREAARQRLAKAKEDLQQRENELNVQKAHTQKEILAIQEQIDALFRTWQQEETKTRKVLEDQQTQLIINGPQVAVAGARNTYDIEVRKQDAVTSNSGRDPFGIGKQGAKKESAQPTAAQGTPLQVRAVDQKNKQILYEQQITVQANNRGQFVLPEDLAITPNSDLALEFQTQSADGKQVQVRDNLKVVFPEYVTHLATDRPMYRPGEVVRFRSLTLERFSLRPAQESFHLRCRIVGPNNVEIAKKEMSSRLVGEADRQARGPDGQPLHGVGAGEFMLPANVPSGQYALIVSEVNDRFHEMRRSFLVNRWQAPRFNKDLQFNRSSYGPGDQVKVNVQVVPVQGNGAAGKNGINVTARFVVDGVVYFNQNQVTDNDGRVAFECALPPQILKGSGAVTIECSNAPTWNP